MKCIKCGHVVEPEGLRTVDAEVKGEHVTVTLKAPQCTNCGRVVILGRHVRAYHRAASDAYRRKFGLLTMEEMDGLRGKLEMKWPEFASYVFVGIATLKRWKRGEIQTQALDRLVRLRTDPRFLEETRIELHARLAKVALGYEVHRQSLGLEWATVSGPRVDRRSVVRIDSPSLLEDTSIVHEGIAA